MNLAYISLIEVLHLDILGDVFTFDCYYLS